MASGVLSDDGVGGTAGTALPASEVLLQVRGVSKTFPGTKALQEVDLTLRSGQVTALVGHNGSGKSTLVKVLAGIYRPDVGGTINDGLGGQDWLGRIHFIHQDLGLIGDLSVVENLDLGRSMGLRSFAPAPVRAERAEARRMMAEFGLEFDVDAPVRSLSAAQRTIVAIARAMGRWSDDRQVLVLDEPTASLQDREAEVLLGIVEEIARRGAAILYVSHRLAEVERLADKAVVLRDGRVVGSLERGAFDRNTLVELIVGHAGDDRASSAIEREPGSRVRLSVRDLWGDRLRGVDLSVSAGEVLGISGVIGSGVEEVLGAVFGSSRRLAGDVLIGDVEVPRSRPARSIRAGMGFVPGDRHRLGAVMTHSGRENLTLPNLSALRTRLGSVSSRRERVHTTEWFATAEVRPGAPERVFAQFSGGNQQKIVLSKWLRNSPGVLLLEEPTQGVDVGAQGAIHDLVRLAASSGAAVVVASSDTKELVDLCDRVVVLHHGVVTAELTGHELNEPNVIRTTLASPARALVLPVPTDDHPRSDRGNHIA